MPGGELGAGDERGDFLLLDDLPIDESLDVGMVDVDDDHLGGAPCRAAGFDRAGGTVADSQEAHQPRGTSASGERLGFASDLEKFEPDPEPYLKRRASRTQRSMIPPSLTRSSATDWMKQACGCGCS